MIFQVGDKVRIARKKLERAQKLFNVLDLPMTVVATSELLLDEKQTQVCNLESEKCLHCGHQQNLNGFASGWFEKVPHE